MLHVGALSSVDALCLLRLWHATPGCTPTPKHGCLSHLAVARTPQTGPALTWTPQLHLGYPHWCIHSREVLLPSSVPVAPNEHLLLCTGTYPPWLGLRLLMPPSSHPAWPLTSPHMDTLFTLIRLSCPSGSPPWATDTYLALPHLTASGPNCLGRERWSSNLTNFFFSGFFFFFNVGHF